MYHTVWKLTALAVVVGIGVAVVVHAQRGMQNNEVAAEQQTADDGDDPVPLAQDDSTEGSLPDQGEPELLTAHRLEATPAAAKMLGDPDRERDIVKTSGLRSLNDADVAGEPSHRSRGRAAASSDPFETAYEESASDPPSALPSTKTSTDSSHAAIDIVDVDDEDDPAHDDQQIEVATTKNKPQGRSRGPVQTLDDADADDSDRPDKDTDDGSSVQSGPRLLGATDDATTAAPLRTSSRGRSSQPPAAKIDTDDPFAEDEAAETGKDLSRSPAASDDGETSFDDNAVQVPPRKSAGDSQARPFKRDLAPLEVDDDQEGIPPSGRSSPRRIETENEQPARRRSGRQPDFTQDEAPDGAGKDEAQQSGERDMDRSPDTAELEAGNRGAGETDQPPAELSRTIEVDSATADETAAPPKPELPQITIEKIAPATAVLGQPMIYHIQVRNVGDNAAYQVVVEDVVPNEVKIDGSIPQALLKDHRLIWKLGTLAAGQERKISVRVVPLSEGTIGGVATVNFAAEPKQNPNLTGPELKFDVAAPRQVAVGTPIEFNFRVRNTGRVPATGVTIRSVLPAALRHPDGDDLEYNIGQLPAGKTSEVKLILTAAQAGPTVNRVVVTADGNVAEEAQVQLDVVGPTLRVVRDGPKRLFPDKTGVYSNTVTNPGLTPVSGISVVETVPAGMEFVEAGDGGKYNAAKRSITWTIGQLGAAASKTVKVTLRSQARGAQVSVVRAYDPAGSSGETVGATHVSGVCALTIEIGEIPALIETGETVKVPVRILNRGSDTAGNVRATIIVPAGMQLLDAQGPTSHREVTSGAAGNASGERAARGAIEVQFAQIAKIETRANAVFEATLRARTRGAARLEVQAQCDQLPEPIRREEITTVVSPQ